jgi:alpha-1,3-rhamnosyl/mannosyltransferase
VLVRLGLQPERYVVSVGTLEPRKNLTRLIRAFERIAGADPDLRLVLLGAAARRAGAILRAVRTSAAADRIVLTGYLPDDERDVVIAGAAVMAYVSVYEGYGLPILDAMAAGVPVVTSGVSAMPEAACGAAVLVDPFDVRSIAAGLRDAMARRKELIAAGRDRVSGLSWDRIAVAVMGIYEWSIGRA